MTIYICIRPAIRIQGILEYLILLSFGEGNGNPLQYSCLENPMDAGAWWAAVYRVAESQTRLKRLSSSSRQISDVTTES